MQRKPRFAHTVTEDLFNYWNRRRGNRVAPDRADIEPGDIRAILPDTFILEVEESARHSWRLAGSRVAALHCRELKGRDFLSDWSGEARATIASVLEAVVKEAAVGVVQFTGKTERDQQAEIEMVLLPLKVFGRPTCRVLGAIALADRPYWVGIAPPASRTIDGMRLLWPSGEPGSVEAPPPITTGNVTPLPFPSLAQTRRYRHLTVVDGGRR
jgi:hypothetical protein